MREHGPSFTKLLKLWTGLLLLTGLGSELHGQFQPRVSPLRADFPFSSSMVLPRDRRFQIRGSATKSRRIVLRFGARTVTARCDEQGRFRIPLGPLPPCSIPRDLELRCAGRRLHLRDLLVGDLWLASGQSNMEQRVRDSDVFQVPGESSIRRSVRILQLRSAPFPGARRFTAEECRRLEAGHLLDRPAWARATEASVSETSAVGWAFAAHRARESGVPQGLVVCAVGGAPIESFLPLASEPDLASRLGIPLRGWTDSPGYPAWCAARARRNLAGRRSSAAIAPHPYAPGLIFSSGIAALTPLRFRGVLWYQGESNALGEGRRPLPPEPYEKRLSAMIQSWRRSFHDPDLPFGIIQLPGYREDWSALREAQARVVARLPHCSLVPALDFGERDGIHPRRKHALGVRLSKAMRAEESGGTRRGPRVVRIAAAEGELILHYRSEGGLLTTDGRAPREFALRGEDRAWHPARARIEGNTLRLHSPAVKRPREVRYAWRGDPQVNLVDGRGLPAEPYRSDRGPVIRTRTVFLAAKAPPHGELGEALGPDFHLQVGRLSELLDASSLGRLEGSSPDRLVVHLRGRCDLETAREIAAGVEAVGSWKQPPLRLVLLEGWEESARAFERCGARVLVIEENAAPARIAATLRSIAKD